MTIVQAAIPAVLGLVALEAAAAALRHRPVYRLADAVTNFGCAAMSQVVGVAVTAVTIGGYRAAAELLHQAGWPVPEWPAGSPVAWTAAFLLVDLGQFLTHWLSHRVNFLWACHAVHHSSGELNYAVGLRNSAFHGFFTWVFFLPLAAAGAPWRMVGLCYGLNVLYQFWLHTRLIGRLGPLEWVFNTPSHHRVHHGVDAKYLDRNFGGVLILWDRLFGTFQAEEEEPRYGLVESPASWNPVWANFHGFALIAAAWRRAESWRERLRAVFGPPECLTGPRPAAPPREPPPVVLSYALLQLVLAIGLTLGIVLASGQPAGLRLSATALVLATLGTLGGLLDGRRWALGGEVARLAGVGMLVAGVLR